MKAFIVLAIAGLVATVSAQDLGLFPSCAGDCIQKNLASAGCTDIKCACSSDSFKNASGTCIQGACSGSDLQKAAAAAVSICQDAGVPISNSSSPTPTTGGKNSTASSTGAASSSTGNVTRSASASASATASSTNAGNHLASVGVLTLLGLGVAGFLGL